MEMEKPLGGGGQSFEELMAKNGYDLPPPPTKKVIKKVEPVDEEMVEEKKDPEPEPEVD